MTVSDPVARPDFGFKEISHNWLKCDDCGQRLVDVMVIKKSSVVMRYKADCPYCGGASVPVSVTGLVAIGADEFGRVIPTDYSEVDGDLVRIRTSQEGV